MILVWKSYKSDLGRAYPLYALNLRQVNDLTATSDPITLLPPAIVNQKMEAKSACSVAALTPRVLILWLSDGSSWQLTYPMPFSENLAEYLTLNTEIAAWEFVGERIKYGRLKRLLDNV